MRTMKQMLLCLAALVVWPLNPQIPARAVGAAPSVAAPFAWETTTPESQEISIRKLDALKEVLAAKKTRAFLVIRNDKIVYEWYAPGVTATMKQGTASLAKALVGGMSLAVAITDGKISIDDPATKFVPEWKNDPRKSRITIRHLGSHTSGLSDSTTENVKHEEQPGWMGDFWKRLDPPRDPFTLARDEAPTLFAPGEKLQYSNPGIGMMTYCVTAAIREGEHKDIRTLLRERVMRLIGVPDAEWSVGYGKTFVVDGLPLVGTWGGGNYTPLATARIGRLVLREGNWEGRQILSGDAVRHVTGDAGLPGNCGMGWWTNGGERYNKLPKDAVWGAGAGDQLLLVVPSLNLIMVRNGETLAPGPGEALVLGVEGVRVLHQELAAAQDAGPGAGLVTVLVLDLVEDHRQVLVGGRLVLHQQGEDLLVGRAEEVVAALAVLEAEQLGAVLVPAARGVVRLPRQQGGEQHLLGADRVHLLTDDPLHVGEDLLAEGQPRPDAGRRAADVAGPDEQLVAEDLGVRRVVTQRLRHQLGHALDRCVRHGSRTPAA